MSNSQFTVEFRIYGKALDPIDVTRRLGESPCQTVLPGSRRAGRILEGMWAFNGNERGNVGTREWTTLEEGLAFLLEKLWSRREVITQYKATGRLIWWCGQFQTAPNSGAIISGKLLAKLGEFGADLFIDTYSSRPD